MAAFEFKFPKNVAKVEAIVATADGSGSITRKRQVGNEIVDRKVEVSGVIATATCRRSVADVMDGKGKDAKKVAEMVAFEGLGEKAFKVAKGKASGVPSKPSIDLDLPEDFSGVVMISAVVDGQPQLVRAIDVEPKSESESE